jgi:hypothetical protein
MIIFIVYNVAEVDCSMVCFLLQDFISILPAAKGQASAPNNEFIITFKKGKEQLRIFLDI